MLEAEPAGAALRGLLKKNTFEYIVQQVLIHYGT